MGAGGAFAATDGGAGYYDATGGAGGPAAPMALGGVGTTIILETFAFTATGPIGSASDIAPLGILGPGLPGVAPPVLAAGPGLEFYDASPAGAGSYAALPLAPNPLWPGGLPAINPGMIRIIPEPGAALLLLGAAVLGWRRRR